MEKQTNFDKCYEWLLTQDKEAAKHYQYIANKHSVNYSDYLEDAISKAFYSPAQTPEGEYFWRDIDTKWREYLEELENAPNEALKKAGEKYKSQATNPQHYNSKKEYDVYSFAHHNNLNGLQMNIVKYVTRYSKKNGKEDLEKAMETLKRLIELEYGTN